jgi:hypothetical protein
VFPQPLHIPFQFIITINQVPNAVQSELLTALPNTLQKDKNLETNWFQTEPTLLAYASVTARPKVL